MAIIGRPKTAVILPRPPPQIVIVGASDTGLSCLEALLTGPRHRGTLFTHLALLSPGGLAAAAASAASGPLAASALGRFALETLERLRLQGLVADVDGTLGAIDTERRVAVLQDGRELPYDVLAIATGLQVGCCGLTACPPRVEQPACGTFGCAWRTTYSCPA